MSKQKVSKKYLVAWVIKITSVDELGNDDVSFHDSYIVYTDKTSIENWEDAHTAYNQIIDRNDTYTANVSEIIASTDYELQRPGGTNLWHWIIAVGGIVTLLFFGYAIIKFVSFIQNLF